METLQMRQAPAKQSFEVVILNSLHHLRDMLDLFLPNAKLTYSLPGGKRKLECVAAKARSLPKQDA